MILGSSFIFQVIITKTFKVNFINYRIYQVSDDFHEDEIWENNYANNLQFKNPSTEIINKVKF